MFIIYFVQDGFFDGELMDGRRGLVPSNFIQKVPGICSNTLFSRTVSSHAFYTSAGNKQLLQ